MPPRPPLANTFKIEVNWTDPEARTCSNIFYGLIDMEPLISNLLILATDLWTVWHNSTAGEGIMARVSEYWNLANITVSDNTGATEGQQTYGTPQPGAAGGSVLPPSASVVASWQIAARYRGGHPRSYLPGLTATDLDTTGGAMLSPTAVTGWTTDLLYMLGAMEEIVIGSEDLQIGTISYIRDKAELDPPVFHQYTSVSVRPRLGTQRRRLGKYVL